MAIEYPEKYSKDLNVFSKDIIININEKLSVDVPEFINSEDKQTHLYLMPPNAFSKIDINKKTKLRLGYSMQSVYDYSSNKYHYVDTQTPLIQLIDNEAI